MRSYTGKLAPLFKEYLNFREAMGFSDCHAHMLHKFDEYCREHHPDVETQTKEVVRGWVSHEIAKGSTVMHRNAASVRSLAKYLGNDAYFLPSKCVPQKPPAKPPYIFTDEELSKLFHAADNLGGGREPFFKQVIPVIFRLYYTCGLRPLEGRLLKRKDINFETGEILISKTKTRKERIVVMSADMLALCREYDAKRSILNITSEYFFIRPTGSPFSGDVLDLAFRQCWVDANPDLPEKQVPQARIYDLSNTHINKIRTFKAEAMFST
jgi:integrase